MRSFTLPYARRISSWGFFPCILRLVSLLLTSHPFCLTALIGPMFPAHARSDSYTQVVSLTPPPIHMLFPTSFRTCRPCPSCPPHTFPTWPSVSVPVWSYRSLPSQLSLSARLSGLPLKTMATPHSHWKVTLMGAFYASHWLQFNS